MTVKDVAFVMLFFLFVLSVLGNVFFLPYYMESDQTEEDLRQKIAILEAEKNNHRHEYDQQIYELEDENEDLKKEIDVIENTLGQLKEELESESGTAISYEILINSLRSRIYDLESETLKLQSDLSECAARKSYYWCDPCYCHPCYYCPPCYSCYQSFSISNVSGTFKGHHYDAVIYMYFDYHPCYVIRIYVDILDLNTIQVVGVDWD
jgi:hypothetical protein